MNEAKTFVRSLSILAAVLLVGNASPASAEHPAQARFRELVPWSPKCLPPVGELVAFEEHAQFVCLAGRLTGPKRPEVADDTPSACIRLILLRPATLVVDICPFDPTQHDVGKPAARAEVELPSRNGKAPTRMLCVYQSSAEQRVVNIDTQIPGEHGRDVAIRTGKGRFRLSLPQHFAEPGRISVESNDGQAILAQRRFPDGVMPLGPDGMRLLDRWDSRYRGSSRPPWDKGFASNHLKAAVKDGHVKPGRAVVLGCGTGTNAVYLAKKGFDVTAIDIAPTALNLAEQKAKKASVKVRWLLADVLAPPADLAPFDFIFDRGCYHGVRRANARGYVKAAKQLSKRGTQVLIIAGNANEERHYGPPRVKEEELRGDFSTDFDFVKLQTVRFDSTEPDGQGALGWLALLRRKSDGGR